MLQECRERPSPIDGVGPGAVAAALYAYDTADRLFQLFENGTTTLLATIGPDEQGRRDWITRNGGAVTEYCPR